MGASGCRSPLRGDPSLCSCPFRSPALGIYNKMLKSFKIGLFPCTGVNRCSFFFFFFVLVVCSSKEGRQDEGDETIYPKRMSLKTPPSKITLPGHIIYVTNTLKTIFLFSGNIPSF